jgi:LPXTG-motif cell wall-anchored protein
MGAGLALLVIGALLAFAVDDEMPHVNLFVAGLILMAAGGLVIWYRRNAPSGSRQDVEDGVAGDAGRPTHDGRSGLRDRRPD